jgi:HlyD family secretion protein
MKALRYLIVIALFAAAGWGGWQYWQRGRAETTTWRQAALDRGQILQAVSSTGALNPVVTVDVGSQVSGQIKTLDADFNTAVKAGQVIARLDPATFEAKVAEARAELAVARANVAMQRASLSEMRAEIDGAQARMKEAELELARKRSLLDRRVVARSEVDKATAARDQARSGIAAARARLARQAAQVENATATVESKAATLRTRELELEHTVIRSPVDGVVISRDVAMGQTVAASLNAPVLFRIAQDLARMQVELSVDEADIGRVRDGQEVTFTVDSYPGRSYAGVVRQIRKAPKEVSNVVTYTVVAETDNADHSLLPGMTANVQVIVAKRDDALRVANAALRFRPPQDDRPEPAASGGNPISAATGFGSGRRRGGALLKRLDEALKLTEAQKAEIGGIIGEMGRKLRGLRRSGAEPEEVRRMAARMRADNDKRIEALLDERQKPIYRRLVAERNSRQARPGGLYVVGPDGQPKRINVMVGITDGNVTEIVRGEIKPGDRVIVGIDRAAPSGG